MYAVKRPRLILALALANLAAALLAALIGVWAVQRGVPKPHEACRTSILYAVVSPVHEGASAAQVTAQLARCTDAAPLAIPTPGYELVDECDCR
jgi:hypothetical protein